MPSLHFALLATGTRGDVQPFVALGEELARRGHHVRVCAHEDFSGLVLRARGKGDANHWSRRMHMVALQKCARHDPSSPAWVASVSLADFVRRTRGERSRQFEQEQIAFLECCQPVLSSSGRHLPRADVIVSSQFTRASSVAVCDLLQIPMWSVNLLPSAPTAAWGPLSGVYPASRPNGMVFHSCKSDADVWSHSRCCCISSGMLHKFRWWEMCFKIVVATLWYTTIATVTHAFRKSLGLPKQTTDESLYGPYYTPTVFAYSNELLPCVPWDWPTWYSVTGFLVLSDVSADEGTGERDAKRSSATNVLAADLERWLSKIEGSDGCCAPVCITFSSMPVDTTLIDALLRALEGMPVVFLFGSNSDVMAALDLKEGRTVQVIVLCCFAQQGRTTD